jgi:hypothetical protein
MTGEIVPDGRIIPEGFVDDLRVYSVQIQATRLPKLLQANRVVVPAVELIKNEFAGKWLAIPHPDDDEDAWIPASFGAPSPEPIEATGTYLEMEKLCAEFNHAQGWPTIGHERADTVMPAWLAFPHPIEMLAA